MKNASFTSTLFLQFLKKTKHGQIEVTFPDGTSHLYGDGPLIAHAELKDWKIMDLIIRKGDLGVAESIIAGTLVVDDLVALIQWACLNDQSLKKIVYGSWYGNLLEKLQRFFTQNRRKQAQKNIIKHYDLGNDFYKLWLDPSMTYSSAIFQSPDEDLYSAQMRKYDRIIEKLEIRASDHILEIGCGWGGFFTRAAQKTGCQVTAVLNSPEQASYNAKKIHELKLIEQVNLIQQDYRDISGQFDKIVSIEMIEAVGEEYWSTFFKKVRTSLRDKRKALIQGITIQEDLFPSYRKNTDFIQQYIFPGGMLLTDKIFEKLGLENRLHLIDIYEFGLDYAETLKIWRKNFTEVLPQIYSMGFDKQFVRLWDLYLSYCEGAFRAGRIHVGQYLYEA